MTASAEGDRLPRAARVLRAAYLLVGDHPPAFPSVDAQRLLSPASVVPYVVL